MTTTMRPLETRYKGYRFRSRLEARWAVGPINEYERVHHAVRKKIPRVCCTCGSTSNVQAALKADADSGTLRQDPRTGCLYSVDLNDYQPLCVCCHRRIDMVEGRPFCRYGHTYTEANTCFLKGGGRRCRKCNREQAKVRSGRADNREKKAIKDREYRLANPRTPEQKARRKELQRKRRDAARSARFEFGEQGGAA
jgi:hypothetical protein